MAEPTVRMSGIVLSSLMFQHVNCDSDAEGLILGDSRFEEQITISDSQADHIHIQEIYNIQKHIACHKLSDFYSSVGKVNMDSVKKLLADDQKERVIGWYRQRRNSDQQMTFREKLVHEKLKTSLSNPHLIFLLLTPSSLTAPGSTHRTEYGAFISRSRRILNVPVSVNNLGLLEQLAYWRVSAPCSAAAYTSTMRRHSSKFFSSDGLLREVTDVSSMNDCLHTELQKACSQVQHSERLVETLQSEVSALRTRIREKKKQRTSQDAGHHHHHHHQQQQQKKNVRLHDAVAALFSCSPLFHSQTLTLGAFPVPPACCRSPQEAEEEEGVSVATERRSETSDGEDVSVLLQRGRRAKRQKETPPENDRKRRKSK